MPEMEGFNVTRETDNNSSFSYEENDILYDDTPGAEIPDPYIPHTVNYLSPASPKRRNVQSISIFKLQSPIKKDSPPKVKTEPRKSHRKKATPKKKKEVVDQNTKTDLNLLLSYPHSSLDSLREKFTEMGSEVASGIDSNGCFLLHLISKNVILLSRILEEENKGNFQLGTKFRMEKPTSTDLETFVFELLKSYPSAMISRDVEGKIPFIYAIEDWVCSIKEDSSYQRVQVNQVEVKVEPKPTEEVGVQKQKSGKEDLRESIIDVKANDTMEKGESQRSLMTLITNLTIPSVFNPAYVSSKRASPVGTRAMYRSRSRSRSRGRPTEVKDIKGAQGQHFIHRQNLDSEFISDDFLSVGNGYVNVDMILPSTVEWCFHILNDIYECIDYSDFVFHAENDPELLSKKQVKQRLILGLISLPYLNECLLLLNQDDPATKRIFALPIIQRVLSSKNAINHWLVNMLEAADSRVVSRAVEYIRFLSQSKIDGDISKEKKNETFESLYQLDFFLFALLSIENNDDINNASGTEAVKYVLDREMMSHSVIALALTDLIFLFGFPIAFNLYVDEFLASTEYALKQQVLLFVTLLGIFYWISRKLSQLSTTKKISRNIFLSNNFRFVDLMNWTAICMTLGGTVIMEIFARNDRDNSSDSTRNYLAFTVLVLYINVMGWFYVVNWQVTKCFQLLTQITKDLFWAVFVFGLVILAFSQAFHIVLKPGCASEDGNFCLSSNAYLHTYLMIFNNYDPDELKPTVSVILFVLFSFFVVVILFNMFTAIAVHSYQKMKKTLTDQQIKGHRARLVYVVDAKSFCGLFQENTNAFTKIVAAIFIFIFAGILCTIIILDIRESFVQSNTEISIIVIVTLIISLLISICSFFSHMTYMSFIVKKQNQKRTSKDMVDKFLFFLALPITSLLRIVLDTHSSKKSHYTAPQWGRKKLTLSDLHNSIKNEFVTVRYNQKVLSEELRDDIITNITSSGTSIRRAIYDMERVYNEKM